MTDRTYIVRFRQSTGVMRNMLVSAANPKAARELAGRRGAAMYGNEIVSVRRDAS